MCGQKKIVNDSWLCRWWLQSLLYVVVQVGFGLLVHPYLTAQLVVKRKLFGWMMFLPLWIAIILVRVWVWANIANWLMLQSDWIKFITKFFINWFVFAIVYWQLGLLYLLVRFKQVESNYD